MMARSVNRVAHIVPPVDGLNAFVRILAASLRTQGIESSIFTPDDAESVRSSGIEFGLFHSNGPTVRAAPVQIHVDHGSAPDGDMFEARIQLFESQMEQRPGSVPVKWIPPGSDIEERLRTISPVTRAETGLGSAGSISATFGSLQDAADTGYLHALSEIMKRFPDHFHLFAGSGNVRSIRAHLHSEGVLSRVRFLGQVSDVAPLLNLVDVYLASFPVTNIASVLDAMGAGKPVVVSRRSCVAELVAIPELMPPGTASYVDTADRLLRNPTWRATQAHAVLDRFRVEFRSEHLGLRYKAFLESI
jgi:glycosyltransferase involved in cell wall biosynthesis